MDGSLASFWDPLGLCQPRKVPLSPRASLCLGPVGAVLFAGYWLEAVPSPLPFTWLPHVVTSHVAAHFVALFFFFSIEDLYVLEKSFPLSYAPDVFFLEKCFFLFYFYVYECLPARE